MNLPSFDLFAIQEVFIFRNHNEIVLFGVSPNFDIRCQVEVKTATWKALIPFEARNRARAQGSWLSTRNFTLYEERRDPFDTPHIQLKPLCPHAQA